MSRRFRLTVIALLLTACTTSPTNRRQVILYSDQQMEQRGIEAYDQMRVEVPVSGNIRQARFVQCVTNSIVNALPDPERSRYEWEVTLFDGEQANAFALPGGKMGVYAGLLGIAENQHQLATVMAHEISHVLANHSNERASQSALRSAGLVAAQILGASESTLNALDTASQLGLFLPFNRTQESEADSLGLNLMARAGFDPTESIVLWVNMSSDGGARPPEFFSTHPSPDTRIRDLRAGMEYALNLRATANSQGISPDCLP